MNHDALVAIYLRNSFYRKKCFIALGLWLLSLIAIIFLVSIALYLIRNPTEPVYFPADRAGRLIAEIPLNRANMSTEAVTAWTANALQRAWSYDFVNYRAQLQSAQQYFTEAGWREYIKALESSNNLLGLTGRKMIAIAKLAGPLVLERQGLMSNGVMAWKFRARVLMEYLLPPYNERSRFANPLNVTVVVRRQDVLQNSDGLGIVQLNASVAVGS